MIVDINRLKGHNVPFVYPKNMISRKTSKRHVIRIKVSARHNYINSASSHYSLYTPRRSLLN